jgi:hypothetical protein
MSAAQATLPVIVINTVTLVGGATITFPNIAGIWWVDISKISGINNVLTFKSGSGTCGTINALTTNDNVIEVLAEGSNVCLLNL